MDSDFFDGNPAMKPHMETGTCCSNVKTRSVQTGFSFWGWQKDRKSGKIKARKERTSADCVMLPGLFFLALKAGFQKQSRKCVFGVK